MHPKRLIVQPQLLAVPWKVENTEKRLASWVENNSSPLLFRSRPLIKIEPVFSYWATLANCPTVFSLFLTFAFVSWNKNQHEQNKSTRRSLAMFFIIILINLSQKHHRRWRQHCLHWQNLKQYKKNIKLWIFRCASIPGIHIGESVSHWCFWDFVNHCLILFQIWSSML